MRYIFRGFKLFQIYVCIFLIVCSNVSYSSSLSNITSNKENTIKKTLIWFTKGNIDPNILAENFSFTSPYYKNENRKAFLAKFRDSTDYKDKVLSKIKSFDPLIILKSVDGNYFSIIAQYHTYTGYSVYETILGKFNSAGLLVELRSIYDLDETKKAFQL